MPWKTGISGNPSGRPPTGRALAELLRKELNRLMPYEGKRTAKKRVFAYLAVQGATEGTIVFPDGTKMQLSEGGWMELVSMLLKHIDGPPPTRTEITGAEGEAIRIILDA